MTASCTCLAKKWQVFAITYFSYAIIYITRKTFSVVKTLIQDDLDLSTYVLGMIDSVFLGTYAIFQVFLPSLSDVFGVRTILLCSIWAAAFFSLTFAISYSPQALIYSWLFEGIAHAPVFAVLIKAVSLWFPLCERGKILGIWTTSQQIGAIVATTLATFISTTFGWRAAFTVASIITAGAAIIVYWTLPEPPSLQTITDSTGLPGVELLPIGKRRKSAASIEEFLSESVEIRVKNNESEDESSARPHSSIPSTRNQSLSATSSNGNTPIKIGVSPSSSFPSESVTDPLSNVQPMRFLDVLRIPNLVSCGIAYFCIKLVRYALLFWLPYFLITELGFSAKLAGYSSMLFDVGGVFGAVASGFLADNLFKGKRLSTAAAMCIVTSLSLFFFSHSATDSRLSLTSSTDSLTLAPSEISLRLPNSSLNDHLFSNYSSTHVAADDGSHLDRTALDVSSFDANVSALALASFSHSVVSLLVATSQPITESNTAALRLLHRRGPSEASDVPANSSILRIPKSPTRPAKFTTILVLITLVGFSVAGPDSILGAAAAGEICARSGDPSAQLALSTATGIVNGLGAFGGVVQGYLTAAISVALGWPALFLILCAASLGSVAALWKCIIEDWTSHTVSVTTSTTRYTPMKRDEKTRD